MNKIPLYVPYIDERDRSNLMDAFDSGWISSKGKYVSQFESDIAEICGKKYAIAVCNGTIALQLALMTLDLPPGSGVICPSLTYISTANAIEASGLVPVFVECDECGVITASTVRKGLQAAIESNIQVSCVIPVNLYGNVCDIQGIRECLDENGYSYVKIIEDCAESFGTQYKGMPSGSDVSDFACYSFFGNKVITTGEGGAVITDSKELYEKAVTIKSVGQKPGAPQRYLHSIMGLNFRMTNLACAIGCAQANKLDEIIEKKQNIRKWYKESLSHDILLKHSAGITTHNNWMITCLVKDNPCREGLMLFLDTMGVENRPAFAPMHIFVNNYKKFVVGDVLFTNTNNFASCGINLPSYPDLKQEQVVYICSKINFFLDRYQRGNV
jgi:perosamine synthetase